MLTGTDLRALPEPATDARGQGAVAMTTRERAQALSAVADLLMQAQTRLCSIPDPPDGEYRAATMGRIADASAAAAVWEGVERAKLA